MKRRTREFLTRFTAMPAIGTFRESRPLTHVGRPPLPHAVLLLHGFSASPAAFAALTPALEARGIPYHAPALTGFGLDDLHLLEVVRASDWRRDALNAYDVLAAVAEEVSVVGLSYGTLLAAFVAAERPVKHLLLAAPYFFEKETRDQAMRRTLQRPLVSRLVRGLGLYIAKPVRPGRATCVDIVDPDEARAFFQYPTLPVSSLLEVWGSPRDVDFSSLRHETLDVIGGAEEQTSDVPAFLAMLDRQGVPYRAHWLPRTAHNVFNDHDKAEAAAIVADVLAGRGAPAG
ncbi:Carboxylesterase [compost metagenome]